MVSKNPSVTDRLDSFECYSVASCINTVQILANLCKIILKRGHLSFYPIESKPVNGSQSVVYSVANGKPTEEDFLIENLDNLVKLGHPLVLEILLLPTVHLQKYISSKKSPQFVPAFLIEQWTIQLLPKRLATDFSDHLDNLSDEFLSYCKSSLINHFTLEDKCVNFNNYLFSFGYRIVNLKNASAFTSCWFCIKLNEKCLDYKLQENVFNDYGALVNTRSASISLPTCIHSTKSATDSYMCNSSLRTPLAISKTHAFSRFSVDELDVIDASVTSVVEWPASPPSYFDNMISMQEGIRSLPSQLFMNSYRVVENSHNLRHFSESCSVIDSPTRLSCNLPKLLFDSPLEYVKNSAPKGRLMKTDSENCPNSHSVFKQSPLELFSMESPLVDSVESSSFREKINFANNSNTAVALKKHSAVDKSLFHESFRSSSTIPCNADEANRSTQLNFSHPFDPFAQYTSSESKLFTPLLSKSFHWRTGLPLDSSPVPVKRHNSTSFDFDESLVPNRHSKHPQKFDQNIPHLPANTEGSLTNGTPSSCNSVKNPGPNSDVKVNRRPSTLSLTNRCTDWLSFKRSPRSDKKLTFSPPSLQSPYCIGANTLHAADTCSTDKWITVTTPQPMTSQQLLINFEESMLNGRIPPSGVVNGFMLDIGASGSFYPAHLKLPVNTYFFNLSDDHAPSPYLGYIDLTSLTNKRGYHVPHKGSIQLTLFNPSNSVLKMFVIQYNLEDMPANCQTFLRQRTVFMPVKAENVLKSNEKDQPKTLPVDSSAGLLFVSGLTMHENGEPNVRILQRKSRRCRPFSTSEKHSSTVCQRLQPSELPTYLRYLVHLRFQTTSSGHLYLHTDIRLIFAREKIEFDPRIATYEMRSFVDAPSNPRYSPKKSK